MKRAGRRTAMAAMLTAVAVTSALAHDATAPAAPRGIWRATLVSPSALVPGVRLAVLPGRVPGLFLESRRSDAVVVLGRAGEPFLRFTADGVEANLRSPLWRENAAALGALVAGNDGASAPDWHRVSPAPRFAWLEFRAWPGLDEPAAEARRWAWTVPIHAGDTTVAFFGRTTWEARTR